VPGSRRPKCVVVFLEILEEEKSFGLARKRKKERKMEGRGGKERELVRMFKPLILLDPA